MRIENRESGTVPGPTQRANNDSLPAQAECPIPTFLRLRIRQWGMGNSEDGSIHDPILINPVLSKSPITEFLRNLLWVPTGRDAILNRNAPASRIFDDPELELPQLRRLLPAARH